MADARKWLWITRWDEFQHYPPEPDRGPSWIKDYTKQLRDVRYLNLSDRQRALLSDLRRVFAVMFPWVPRDVAVIARQRGRQTFRADLEALNKAGFIEFCSRPTLERRLEEFYASRAPARSRRSKKEKDLKPSAVSEGPSDARDNGAAPSPGEQHPDFLKRMETEIPWSIP
jgi:hypothetical protein